MKKKFEKQAVAKKNSTSKKNTKKGAAKKEK
jgi:hypothetical protein